MKKFAFASAAVSAVSAAAASLTTSAAYACGMRCPVKAVPEISALEGTAAIAALAAIVLLTWERRRRAH